MITVEGKVLVARILAMKINLYSRISFEMLTYTTESDSDPVLTRQSRKKLARHIAPEMKMKMKMTKMVEILSLIIRIIQKL